MFFLSKITLHKICDSFNNFITSQIKYLKVANIRRLAKFYIHLYMMNMAIWNPLCSLKFHSFKKLSVKKTNFVSSIQCISFLSFFCHNFRWSDSRRKPYTGLITTRYLLIKSVIFLNLTWLYNNGKVHAIIICHSKAMWIFH